MVWLFLLVNYAVGYVCQTIANQRRLARLN